MKIIYELPKSYKEFVRHSWTNIVASYGLDSLDLRLMDTFKLAYQELLNDAVRCALFDSTVPVHINRAVLDELVATAIESFTEEECHSLIDNARDAVCLDCDDKMILNVMADTAWSFENEDEPDNYLEIHMLATRLISITFNAILECIADDMDLINSFATAAEYDGNKRTGQLIDSGRSGVSISSDYSFVVVEV